MHRLVERRSDDKPLWDAVGVLNRPVRLMVAIGCGVGLFTTAAEQAAGVLSAKCPSASWGAGRFGWEKRTPEPRSMRDGRYLIGQGMAGAIFTHWRWPAKARVTLSPDGSALVEAGTHDLGTGTYTVMQQVAAETLGLPPEKVTVRLRDTKLPMSHPSNGSSTLANAGASVMLQRRSLRPAT